MEELICIENVSRYFEKGNSYKTHLSDDGVPLAVIDGEGYPWDLHDNQDGTFYIPAMRRYVLFTTAPNHDARADDSEGGCRE